mgnify:CR=1 FL=1
MDITIEKRIEHVCKTIYDPEIPQNIWDLGLVYSIGTELFEKKGLIDIVMTLTTPACPVGPEFLNNVKTRVEEIKEEPVKIEEPLSDAIKCESGPHHYRCYEETDEENTESTGTVIPSGPTDR